MTTRAQQQTRYVVTPEGTAALGRVPNPKLTTLLDHLQDVHSGYAGNYKVKNLDDAPVNLMYLMGLHDGTHRKVGTSAEDHPYG